MSNDFGGNAPVMPEDALQLLHMVFETYATGSFERETLLQEMGVTQYEIQQALDVLNKQELENGHDETIEFIKARHFIHGWGNPDDQDQSIAKGINDLENIIDTGGVFYASAANILAANLMDNFGVEQDFQRAAYILHHTISQFKTQTLSLQFKIKVEEKYDCANATKSMCDTLEQMFEFCEEKLQEQAVAQFEAKKIAAHKAQMPSVPMGQVLPFPSRDPK